MIKEIGQYIENNTTLVIGSDLFVGHIPEDAPDDCTGVLETGVGIQDFYIKDKTEKTIQIITRGREYHETRDKAYEVFNFLHARKIDTLPVVGSNTYQVNTIESLNQPQLIQRDEKGLWEFSTNYIFRIQTIS